MPYLMQKNQRPMGPGGAPGGYRGHQGGKPGQQNVRPNNRGNSYGIPRQQQMVQPQS